jgi:ATP-dependent Clp protease ATP-binding subunit ClpC
MLTPILLVVMVCANTALLPQARLRPIGLAPTMSQIAKTDQALDFDRFSEPALQTLFFARSAASELGGSSLTPEHLLLGMLHADSEVVTRFLGSSESKDATIQQIRNQVSVGVRVAPQVEIPLSPETTLVLRRAVDNASETGDRAVHPEHILLSLLENSQGRAIDVLRMNGVSASAVRMDLQTRAKAQQK